MAAPAIGTRRRWTPPPTAQLDRGHPLSQRLVGAWASGVVFAGVQHSTTTPGGVSALGPACVGNGSSSCGAMYVGPFATANSNLTMVWFGRKQSGSSGNGAVLSFQQGPTGAAGLALGFGGSTFDNAGNQLILLRSGSAWLTLGSTVPDGEIMLAVSWDTTNGIYRWFVNGSNVGGSASPPGASFNTASSNALIVGAETTSLRALPSTVVTTAAFGYTRALGIDEIGDLWHDPFQMFRW
jgi:hypothetical protein